MVQRLPPHLTTRSRQLRHAGNIIEALLWRKLSRRQVGGFKFRRQYVVDQFIADFACLEKNLLIEIDGESHSLQAGYDKARTTYLESKGFRVLRFNNADVYKNIGMVVDTILAALQE